jgi:alkanesulfonate monooxygenase
MADVGRFGVFLPSYIWEGDGPERARGIKTFAREVEDLGFDSLFITDHLLAAKRFYSVNWLEPLTTLAVAAGATERVRLGTSILIMPLRNPVILAKELATLQFLSDNRVILGAGVGWNESEYEAVGVHKAERGKRTDEMLDIMLPLLEGERVTYHGKYYDVDDVFIEPRTSQRPLLWIGGGSQLADPKSPDVPKFVESVKQRTLRSDGWIPRPTCPPEDIARDWQELQAAFRDAGRDPSDCLVAHENFLHLVITNDPVKAREEQHEAFLKVMSNERGPKYLETVYLFGTPDEIIASLQARVDAGVEYFFLHTMTPDPAQLRLWADHIIPNVTFPATAGPVRRPPQPAVAAVS